MRWTLTPGLVGGTEAAPVEWPPTDFFVRSLAAGVEPILEAEDGNTGRFGRDPWICLDQNVLFALAVAWATEHPDNPWHHDQRLLQAIDRGGLALVDDQDEQGMWTFRKKDHSTWGQTLMPWTYSRWIRAYSLVREALPAADRARWEAGLTLGFSHIRPIMDGHVHNIPCHHAMGLYIAGLCFDEPDWRQAATGMMRRVVAGQDPSGFWSEHCGPVIGYNAVYVEALGTYYAYSHDDEVLAALRRSAYYHANILWSDGSTVAAIDERMIYHRGRNLGNVGLSFSPEGRGYLVQQLAAQAADGQPVPADYAASMLLHAGSGEVVLPPATGDESSFVLGAGEALIQRHRPWQWCFSAYACEPPRTRWQQNRHNLVDVFHDELGLVVGGGNTKLQPYWSTFTVGDPSLLSHRQGEENPEFLPAIQLQWYPDRGTIEQPDDGPARLAVGYGPVAASVTAEPGDGGSLTLVYRAEPLAGRVEAHLPLMRRSGPLQLGSGRLLELDEEDVLLAPADLGGALSWAGLHLELPPGASLRWPCRQHNPYAKYGESSLDDAKLVIVLPFDKVTEQRVRLSRTALG